MKNIAYPFVAFNEKHGERLRLKVSFEDAQERLVKLREVAGSSLRRNAHLPVLGAALTFAAFLDVAPAGASAVFASGPFTLPEGITTGLDGTYILSDADNQEVYSIPAGGGVVTSGTPMSFRVFGEVVLPSGYAQSGQYLAYGTNSASVNGVAALTGASGLGTPNVVINTTVSWFGDAVVAPESFGTIAKGQVLLTNQSNSIDPSIPSTVDVLNYNGAGISTFADLPSGVSPLGLGFAPTSFGASGGDLFVSDGGSGKLYVLNSAGHASVFATLPLPVGFKAPGLRQFEWAPEGFTLADGQDVGGDLFVSIAAQNGGGGTTGYIDVLNAAGDTVAHYRQGSDVSPLDPRGLFFVNNTTLLVANADPGIQLLTPADFASGSPVPESSTWAMLLMGFAGLVWAGWRRDPSSAT
jgi:hypothetical protein